MQLPEALEVVTPHMFEAKHGLAGMIVEAEKNPVDMELKGEKQGALQKAIITTLTKYWSSKGIDTEKSAHIIQEFAHISARKLAEQYKDRPEVIYTLIEQIKRQDLGKYLTMQDKTIAEKARSLLTANDIYAIYETHKDHTEDFAAFFDYLNKNNSTSNNSTY